MPAMFHVSSSANRASIEAHGLDWTRMVAVPGIAGSTAPEVDGVFLCRGGDVGFFVRLNNTGTAVDVWSVDDVDESLLVDGPNGWPYLPEPIAPTRLRLVRRDVAPRDPSRDRSADASSGAYRSRLTITFNDGRVLTGDEATEFVRQRKT